MASGRRRRILDPGSRAPDFRLPRLHGGVSALAELVAGGPVLLVFFKVTCPVCQMALPFLERIHAAGTLPTLSIYGISQDDDGDTREFNREFGITFPTLLDTEESGFPVSGDYRISSVPSMFVVGQDGRISQAMEGWNRREILALGALAGVNPFHQGENVPEWKAG
jgi:peroxiredoxin